MKIKIKNKPELLVKKYWFSWLCIVYFIFSTGFATVEGNSPEAHRRAIILDASYYGNLNFGYDGAGAFQLQSSILTEAKVMGFSYGLGFTVFGSGMEYATKRNRPSNFFSPYIFAGYLFPHKERLFSGCDLSMGITNATFWSTSYYDSFRINMPYSKLQGVATGSYFLGLYTVPKEKTFFSVRMNLSLTMLSGGAFIPMIGISTGMGFRK